LREFGHGTSAYTPLQENLVGEVGKAYLTIEAVGAAEGDVVDRESGVKVKEGAPRPTS
jgi:hypothetical protein